MKKKILFFLFLSIPFVFLFAQNDNKDFLEFSFGRSNHGTGDISGYHYGFSFAHEFSRKLSWQIGFEGTTNDTPDFLLKYNDDFGNEYDASLHTVISGFQLVAGVKYNFVETDNSRFGVSVLPVFRYQATSQSDLYYTLYPAATGLPIPVREILRFESGRTFAVGSSFRLQYQYQFSNDFYIGLLGGFQFDTQGDTIFHASLSVAKRL